MTYRQPFRGDYRITQRYGEHIDGVTVGPAHTGIDYACPLGTQILASEAGTVMACGWDSTGFGYRVIIKHGDGRATMYAHLSKVMVTLYELVAQGDPIGLSGYSGNVFPEGPAGAHLHFEARKKWNDYKSHFDPMDLPLMNFADATTGKPEGTSQNLAGTSQKLKNADAFQPGVLAIVAPDGAKVFRPDWTILPYGFPMGTKVHYTGRTAERNGYTYMEVYEDPPKRWVAVHDHRTQIIDEEK